MLNELLIIISVVNTIGMIISIIDLFITLKDK